ncbi:MAG: hypothetical protein KatS3mg129_0265 [Leptospiraceae bacterium]|nr:MAG: hypothetical protein KatS3mg129_0265 [Leptospiraceae bacterium]
MIVQHLKGYFNTKKNLFTTISLMALSSLATGMIQSFLTQQSCKIDKPAYIYFKNQDTKQGILSSINIDKIQLKEPSESEEEYTINDYSLDSIKKIVFFSDEDSFKEDLLSTYQNYTIKNFIGKYKITAGGHEGYLTIYYTQSGFPGGYVQFPHWGKGKIEFLQFLQIKGNSIQFIRSCSDRSCIEIGAPYEFKQIYYGSLNNKGEIEGKYTGTHSSGQWKAIRIK